MKNLMILTLFLSLISGKINAQSDNVSSSETTIPLSAKRLEATAICLDAIEAPTKYNEFAKQFISMPNFPQKTSSTTSETLKNNIDSWLINHPEVIETVLKERKKAHDILYGPRPY